MAKQNIKDFVADAIEEYLETLDLEIWNIEYVKEGRDWFLRLYIDRKEKDEYVSMDDCQAVSEYLSDVLDEEAPIEKKYYLEVSSPGIERELFTTKQLRQNIGCEVLIKLYRAIDGKKKIEAILENADDDNLLINSNGSQQEIKRSDVAKINLVAKW